MKRASLRHPADVLQSDVTQVLQDVDTSADKIVDRIRRYGGKSAPEYPWPTENAESYDLDSATDSGTERKPATPERKPATPEKRAERSAVTEEEQLRKGRNAGEKSPIDFWDNFGQAERFRWVADCKRESALTDREAFYRAGVLRARGKAPMRKRQTSFTVVTAEELAGHTRKDSKWVAIHGEVN